MVAMASTKVGHVLMCRGVSYWVLNYCRHILFGRRVLHKIQSTYRPPLAIHNGVDMGRAFSVLLFCIAMDPWYYHVHQIPRVLINRGYMDDNATGGTGLDWLFQAQTLFFQKISDAGFVVLSHHCYTVEIISTPPYQTPCFLSCEPVICHPLSDLHICAFVRDLAVSFFILPFFLFPLILLAMSILIFFLFSILQHVNVSAKPFSSPISLFLPLTFLYLTPPLGGARLFLLLPLC